MSDRNRRREQPRRDDRAQRSGGGYEQRRPPEARSGGERRPPSGGGGRSPQSPQASAVPGSYTERKQRPPTPRDSNGQRYRPKSADGGSNRGSVSYRGSQASYVSGSSYGGYPQKNPMHEVTRDPNQFAMNSPAHTGGRLPNGRLLSGWATEGMVHHPRCGQSRTQFGGMWEDHKIGDRPVQSNTRTGFSDFGDVEPPDTSTYAHHFGTFFDGADTMSHLKPNKCGFATVARGVNGFGRNATGGFCTREQMGDLPRYNHADTWRGMPAWARKIPEPTRPGPGYTRTDQGGYFRT
jgi:hypothetical protein